jgi:hypothetical protein
MRSVIMMSIIALGGLSGAAIAASATSVRKVVVVKKTVARDGTVKTAVTGDPAARAIVASCGDRRFETSAEVDQQGRKRVIKIKLCAKPGEDQATWVKSLRQAATTIEETESLPSEGRTKIVADIDAEIARIDAGTAASVVEGPPK